MQRVDLALHQRLEVPRRDIHYIYFPESGCLSVIADGPKGQRVEVGMIGPEGMSGSAVVLEVDRTSNETIVQNAGSALRISVGKFRKAMKQSASLRSRLIRYAHTFLIKSAREPERTHDTRSKNASPAGC